MPTLTIAQAASRLGVSAARVSQLLSSCALEGPAQPPGKRAPKNAPRVWEESLERHLLVRRDGRKRGADPQPAEVATLRDDAIRLKIALDVTHEQLVEQRQQTARVTQMLADAVETLQREQDLARRSDEVYESMSTTLTSHLLPDTSA